MMTFHPPAPFRFVGRRAKNGDVIQFRITHRPTTLVPKDVFELPDRASFPQTFLTQAAFQQQIGCIALCRSKNFEGYTFSLSRYVVPVQALLIRKRDSRLCALLLSEGCEEFLPSSNELRCRISPGLLPSERCNRGRSQDG